MYVLLFIIMVKHYTYMYVYFMPGKTNLPE